MVFTDIKQAIGSRLLDVKEYTINLPIDYYKWTVHVFDSGILIKQFFWKLHSHYMGTFIKDANKHMPEELKQLIEQYK